jgi:hypothetical protein
MTPEQTIDTTPAGLDSLADHLAVEWDLSATERVRLRAKLAEIENVVLHPTTGQPARMVQHEQAGDWRRDRRVTAEGPLVGRPGRSVRPQRRERGSAARDPLPASQRRTAQARRSP